MTTSRWRWSSIRLSSVSIASSPKSSRSPSRASEYASSTKRTPSSARRITRSVLIAVRPTYWPTSPARSTSTRWPRRSSPIERYISASSRATVVLPVPGFPRKTRCCVVATSDRPVSFRRACTRRNATSARTCSFTVSRPGRESSSASSSSSGRGGSCLRSRSISSSSPTVARSCSPRLRSDSNGFGGIARPRYPLPSARMPGPMKPDELARYAEMIVRGCIALGRGDSVIVHANTAHRPLVGAIAEAAYAAGAASVDAVYEDATVTAARFRHGDDGAIGHRTSWELERRRAHGREDTAVVRIMGELESRVLADLPPELVAEDAKRAQARAPGAAKARREGRLRGTICAWPTAEWAGRVFPGVGAAQAERRLARDLLAF